MCQQHEYNACCCSNEAGTKAEEISSSPIVLYSECASNSSTMLAVVPVRLIQMGINCSGRLRTYCKIGVSLFAVASDYQRIVLIVLLQELLRIIIRIDVDLCECIVDCLLLVAGSQCCLEKGEQQLETVSGFNLCNELIYGHRGWVDS